VVVEEDDPLVDCPRSRGLALHDGHGNRAELPLLSYSLTNVVEDDGVRITDVVEGIEKSISLRHVHRMARRVWWW
jgi:hypothetical protein